MYTYLSLLGVLSISHQLLLNIQISIIYAILETSFAILKEFPGLHNIFYFIFQVWANMIFFCGIYRNKRSSQTIPWTGLSVLFFPGAWGYFCYHHLHQVYKRWNLNTIRVGGGKKKKNSNQGESSYCAEERKLWGNFDSKGERGEAVIPAQVWAEHKYKRNQLYSDSFR